MTTQLVLPRALTRLGLSIHMAKASLFMIHPKIYINKTNINIPNNSLLFSLMAYEMLIKGT